MRTYISIETVPNVPFEEARQRAVLAMAKELGIRPE